ncbi:related to NTG2-DNA N-glycosylase and apurinic/apyrimidinic (AP) lyase involved in base excision repair [Sporisorium scitamineum]|uniref:Related to NTG2-DNA N-glycosylase and apurinic/apyrimidinic (AP) lyase involved in base excision repair n=1 Tax=Sporisorium scitamineum TaxID=49012 RepID=A0A127ZCN4_9BASI|nr:related to NTG2-DNA N-glycosylase and apurinic/apyrimidinic (AP) lyase involved in base excision repair [Sporisorium scitamineum]
MTPSTPTRTSPRKGAASAARAVSTAPPAIKAEVEDVELPPTPSSVGDSPAQGKRKRGSVKNETSEIGDLLSTPAKLEEVDDKNGITSAPTSPSKKQTTSERKLASYKTSILGSPFPDHPLPTPHEAERVAWILGEFHGYKRESAGGRGLPKYTTPKDQDTWGGCGNVPSVLDALIRTVLSCNTSNRNSAAAHRSLTEHFGRANWSAIHAAPEHELVQAIRCGGLANNKARTIKGILAQTHQKYGKLSLDHLHDATDDEIMQELVGFNGVGPKVASCVLAFCIGRESMAVDTHVFRLCKALGWVPEKANRDQTYYHLHERIPGGLKYALHVLLIQHGKRCANCSAKGFATVKEERGSDGEEEVDGDRVCPLKKNGLLGRKGKALRDAAAATAANAAVESSSSGNRSDVKVEKQEPTDFNTDSAASPSKKPKPNQIGYAAALQTALASTSTDLLHLLQHSRSTRSSNPISPHLKTRHYSLELLHASQLSSEQRKRIFHLFERNMKTLYRNSTLGWKPTLKKRELFDPSSRFAIVRPPPEEGAEIAAFAMFRFDTEPCHPSDPTARQGEQAVEVVYLYEIQVRRESQRDGLGRELMDVVWQLGKRVGMRKVMLTVFDENRGARRFYERMGYGVDPASPSLDDEVKGRVDFVTMFKRL